MTRFLEREKKDVSSERRRVEKTQLSDELSGVEDQVVELVVSVNLYRVKFGLNTSEFERWPRIARRKTHDSSPHFTSPVVDGRTFAEEVRLDLSLLLLDFQNISYSGNCCLDVGDLEQGGELTSEEGFGRRRERCRKGFE